MRLRNLGYASTAHRAQGSTVDTAHSLIDPETASRELLYVAMTRGRQRNDAYVVQPDPHEAEPHLEWPVERTVTEQLARVLARSDADLSATEPLVREVDRHASLATLLGEYDLLAREAQAERWATLLDSAPLPEEVADEVFTSPYYEYLEGALARHGAAGHDVSAALMSLVPTIASGGAQADPAALLGATLDRATTNGKRPRGRAVRRVAGLIPVPREPIADDLRVALNERQALIEAAARRIARGSIAAGAAWTTQLRRPDTGRAAERRWMNEVATIALYRERYGVAGPMPLGRPADIQKAQQAVEYRAAYAALKRANEAAASAFTSSARRSAVTRAKTLG